MYVSLGLSELNARPIFRQFISFMSSTFDAVGRRYNKLQYYTVLDTQLE